jgi:hypothetical protein
MSIQKYSSRNEDSLLKSLGPHLTAITSHEIEKFEQEITVVGTHRIVGTIEIYGEVTA